MQKPEEGLTSPGAVSHRRGHWKLSSGPLQSKQVLSTPEPLLQPPKGLKSVFYPTYKDEMATLHLLHKATLVPLRKYKRAQPSMQGQDILQAHLYFHKAPYRTQTTLTEIEKKIRFTIGLHWNHFKYPGTKGNARSLNGSTPMWHPGLPPGLYSQ